MSKIMELLNHTSAACNVEVRFPFMDVRLIEYCLSLPSDQKLRGGCTRFVMHNAMAGVLPDKIQNRATKSNLAPSFERGLFKFERDNFAAIILEEAGRLSAFVDLTRIKACLVHFQSGGASENEMNALWAAAGLALWLRQRTPSPKNLSYNERG
jgi:asparagine synthase (glutamine-hydrolysing)